jgi:Flp pilus assembly protein TadG
MKRAQASEETVFMSTTYIRIHPLRSSTAIKRLTAKLRCDQGGSLVEMAISSLILITLLFGLVEFSFAYFTSNVVSQAAREATRYASIRGYNSCTYATSTFPNCNLGPDATGTSDAATAIQSYLISRNYPLTGNLQVVANWYSPTGGTPNAWTLSCNTAIDGNTTSPLNGDACNYPGHAVQVQVSIAFPLSLPIFGSKNINLTSTSQMIISE